jgi:hypothetical protein
LKFCAVALGAWLGAALQAGAQAPIAVGSEFQVNSFTTGAQFATSVAAESDGGFVVVWCSLGSSGTDASSNSVQGQRFASDGSTVGVQFQVNSYTTNLQCTPTVAADADGDFVVAWESTGSPGTDTSSNSVQGQRYASNGSAQGAQFQVNAYTTNAQLAASAAAEGNGDFVVVWHSTGSSGTDTLLQSIQGQRYDSSGTTLGPQFQVNTYTTSGQRYPAVAGDADGDFVVVWASIGSSGTDPTGYSVQGQRYASDGSTRGAQFQVNTYTTSNQGAASVAADAVGDFVVTWTSDGSSGTDTSGFSIQGQRYASDGSLRGAQFQVNTYTTSNQRVPRVAMDTDGDFVVVWESTGSSGTDSSLDSVQGQRFASDGSPRGAEFQVNTYTTGGSYTPAVSARADGNFVVAWESQGSFGTDTSPPSVLGQRYRVPGPPPVSALSPSMGLALVAGLILGASYAIRRRA